MAAFDDVVIISGCRTPVGKFQGSLSDLSATKLGAMVVKEAVKRANLKPECQVYVNQSLGEILLMPGAILLGHSTHWYKAQNVISRKSET